MNGLLQRHFLKVLLRLNPFKEFQLIPKRIMHRHAFCAPELRFQTGTIVFVFLCQ